MTTELTDKQATFAAFAQEAIAPHADQWDREERLPREIIEGLAERGYLASTLPQEFGGAGLDMATYGLLNEEIGRACSSVRSLMTVHDMVARAIHRWGTDAQKAAWLPRLASGERIGAFALTEPNVGSDAKSVEASAGLSDGTYILNGKKKWITFGQIADVFLVIARSGERPSAFLVERGNPGLTVAPISGMLGLKAGMLAEIEMKECRIPAENLLGRDGTGLVAVATTALDLGRYSVACGCVGIGRACLDASLEHTATRKQFGALLKEHQLIRRMITDTIVNVKAARLLCRHAGDLKDAGDPNAVMETLVAKYFASTMVTRVAADAVQVHGALGCSGETPVQRYLRDAQVMEIIEGSTQILQINLANYGYRGMT